MNINTKTKYVKERYDALIPKIIQIPSSILPKKIFSNSFLK